MILKQKKKEKKGERKRRKIVWKKSGKIERKICEKSVKEKREKYLERKIYF